MPMVSVLLVLLIPLARGQLDLLFGGMNRRVRETKAESHARIKIRLGCSSHIG